MCLTNIQKPPNLRKPIIVDQSKNRPRKVCFRAEGRMKIDLKDFQLYTLLPGYVSLLLHVRVSEVVAPVARAKGPPRTGVGSVAARTPEPLARPLADTRCSHGDGRPSGVGSILQAL